MSDYRKEAREDAVQMIQNFQDEILDKLLAALRLYVKLDNDRRAGCEIAPEDWAECHQAAMTAISKTTGT